MHQEWNLKDLFENQNDIDKSVEELKKRSLQFSKQNGTLSKLSEDDFLALLSEYEDMIDGISKVLTYAYLSFATDSKKGAYLAKYEEIYNDINENLLFFELEFNTLSDEVQDKFIAHCKKYEYYLKCLKDDKAYQLSQKEEKILLKTSLLGQNAFSRLFDEHLSNLKFNFDDKLLSEEEVLSLLQDSNREVRKKAALSLSEGLKPHQHLIAYIYNMIKKDLKIKCDLRGYLNCELPRHNSNKISQKSVDTLINASENSYYLFGAYYDLKKKLLGFDELYDYDRYAPFNQNSSDIDFENAKKMVLDAFNAFSPKFYEIALKAFDEKWIDVYPKEGKRGGAFSHSAVQSAHPYILLNYTNKRRDVFTLAHELGHSIHQYLSNPQGCLNSDTPLTTAETASIFAEMLTFDAMKKNLSKDELKALLGSKLEDIFATLFRQINFTTFERRIHGYDGELNHDKIGEFWVEENKKLFGDSIKMGEYYKYWWSYIPHFIHTPFYCYAYGYGQLLVLAIYGLYKSGKLPNFVEIYTKFLSLGGSKSPKELVEMFGFDIEKEDFWQIGLEEIKKLYEEFRELA